MRSLAVKISYPPNNETGVPPLKAFYFRGEAILRKDDGLPKFLDDSHVDIRPKGQSFDGFLMIFPWGKDVSVYRTMLAALGNDYVSLVDCILEIAIV